MKWGKTTLKESPTARMGALLQSADDVEHIAIRGYERSEHPRLLSGDAFSVILCAWHFPCTLPANWGLL
ncbi:MAG: hypothetical protein IJL54_04335 [Prevotella sp.]|nr:hypothetical protein [Prevotella sp.]